MRRSARTRSISRGVRISLAAAMVLVGAVAVLPAMGQKATTEGSRSGTLTAAPVATEKIGTVHFPITSSKEAQAEFDRGVAMLHSFWFEPAIESFNRVTELDPTTAMGHWGVAMCMLGNPFAWPTSASLESGAEAAKKARAIGGKTAREEGYLAAISAFYSGYDTVEHRTRAVAYREALESLAGSYPEDAEARIFYAMLLDATADPTDKSYTNQLKAARILEEIFAEQPDHPGVAHYLIHSYDYPSLAERGLDAAFRYADIAPAAPHALHMPSHIFSRLGYWQESIETNVASDAVARSRLPASSGDTVASLDVMHALDYQMYAYLQLGRDSDAQSILDRAKAIESLTSQHIGSAYALAAMPSRYVLERNQWAEAAELTLHPAVEWGRAAPAKSILLFSRGLGAARNGDTAAAELELEQIRGIRDRLSEAGNGYWAGQSEIQAALIAGWISFAQGNNDEALRLLRKATELEDATEKHPVTPGPIKPAHELLGELYLELDQPALALAEFERTLVTEPRRFLALYGAGRAAELSGDQAKARRYYLELSNMADGSRQEIRRAEAHVASR